MIHCYSVRQLIRNLLSTVTSQPSILNLVKGKSNDNTMRLGRRLGASCLFLMWTGLVLSSMIEDLVFVHKNLTYKLDSHRSLRLLDSFSEAFAHEAVFIGSDTFGTTSMGNWMSVYFDSLACCDIVGAHFVYRGSIVGDEQVTKFFKALPQIRIHSHPANKSAEEITKDWNNACPYVFPYPHVHEGAWNQRPHIIAKIIHRAINAVFPSVLNETISVASFSNILPKKLEAKELPLIPSAAIVFRCVDILFFKSDEPNYGFLNFNAYKELIPQNATTIYVLSEQLQYLNKNSRHSHYCQDLGTYLIEFLHQHFPQAVVALRRGYPIESFTMLSHAKTVISAPSSFPLFPGIANPNNVYLMASGKRPVYYDQPYLRDNFMWLTSPAVIMGGEHLHKDKDQIVSKFKKLFTKPLSEPVQFATHLPKVDYCAQFPSTVAECIRS